MRPQYPRDPGDHTELTPDKLVTFVLQDHNDRRGKHLDVRLGDQQTGLFSWATRHPNLPRPGQDPITLYRASKHPYGWGNYQGPLRRGGSVRIKERGRAKITESEPKRLGFNLVDRDPIDAYLFKKLTENSWLAINRNPEAIASVLKKVKEAGEAKSPPIYHGSSVADLKRIDPRPSRVLGGEEAVFGTPDRDLAVSFGQPWRDDDFAQGYRDGQPYMREQYEGAFEKIFGGKPGAIYTLPGGGFAADPRLMKEERISRAGVTPESVERIADALAALRATRFKLEPYQPREKVKEANAAVAPGVDGSVCRRSVARTSGCGPEDAGSNPVGMPSMYKLAAYLTAQRGPAEKTAEAKPAACTCPDYPRIKMRSGSGHKFECPIHIEWKAAGGFGNPDAAGKVLEKYASAGIEEAKEAGAVWRSPEALKSILGRMGVSLSSRAQGLAHVRNQLVGSPELPGVQKFVSKLPKIDGLDLLPDVPIAKAKSWEPSVVFRGSSTDGGVGPHGYQHATPWAATALTYADTRPPDLRVPAPSFLTAYKTAPGQPYFRDFGIENREAPRSATQVLQGAQKILADAKPNKAPSPSGMLSPAELDSRIHLNAHTYETPVYPEVNPIAQRYFKGNRSFDLHELPQTPVGESFYRSLAQPLGQWSPKEYPKHAPWRMPEPTPPRSWIDRILGVKAPAEDPIAAVRRALPPVHPEEAFHPTPAPTLHTPENPLSLDELTAMLRAKGLAEPAIQAFQKMWQANSKVAGARASVLSGHYETIPIRDTTRARSAVQSQDRGQVRSVGSDRPSAEQARVPRRLVDLSLRLRDGEGHQSTLVDPDRKAPDAILRLLGQGSASDARSGAYEDVPSLARHAQPVLQPQRQDVPPLRRSGDHGLRKLAEVRGVLCGYGSSAAGPDSRTEGQQQGLLARQLPLGDQGRAGEKQAEQSAPYGRRGNTPDVGLGGTERGGVCNYPATSPSWLFGCGSRVTAPAEPQQIKTADLLPGVKLQPHQERVRERMAPEGARMLLVHGLGTGKSLSAIAAAEAGGGPYTVVTPASLRNNFRGEIDRWSDKSSPVSVMSFNAAAAGKEPDYDPNMLIVDEAQTIRNPESQKAKGVERLAEKAHRLALLSGTPVVNGPGDLAEPLYLLTGKRYSPEAFTQRYVRNEQVSPGIFRRLMGVEPGVRQTINRRNELIRMLRGHVDYQPPETPEGVTTHDERVEVEMSPEQAQFHELAWGRLPFYTRWKLQHQFPLAPRETRRLSAFMTGPRQASLSLGKYTDNDPQRAYSSSPKLREAGERLQKALEDPRVKALVFSNFVGSGLKPYADHLQRRGVPAALFDGSMSDAERKKAVDDYNAGKLRVLMLGPSGSEGISTKGTQLIQLLDPHFNAARGDQSRGRGLRFDSHTGLPDDLRNVHIQRFIARTPDPSWLRRHLGGMRHPSSDEILERMAAEKERLNEEFRGVLRDAARA